MEFEFLSLQSQKNLPAEVDDKLYEHSDLPAILQKYLGTKDSIETKRVKSSGLKENEVVIKPSFEELFTNKKTRTAPHPDPAAMQDALTAAETNDPAINHSFTKYDYPNEGYSDLQKTGLTYANKIFIGAAEGGKIISNTASDVVATIKGSPSAVYKFTVDTVSNVAKNVQDTTTGAIQTIKETGNSLGKKASGVVNTIGDTAGHIYDAYFGNKHVYFHAQSKTDNSVNVEVLKEMPGQNNDPNEKVLVPVPVEEQKTKPVEKSLWQKLKFWAKKRKLRKF